MSKTRVFVDTNIILEALTGNQLNPKYIPVDGKKLTDGLSARHMEFI